MGVLCYAVLSSSVVVVVVVVDTRSDLPYSKHRRTIGWARPSHRRSVFFLLSLDDPLASSKTTNDLLYDGRSFGPPRSRRHLESAYSNMM